MTSNVEKSKAKELALKGNDELIPSILDIYLFILYHVLSPEVENIRNLKIKINMKLNYCVQKL